MTHCGGVAQMVERSLSMREVPGSIPGASNLFYYCCVFEQFNHKNLHRPGIEPGPPAWQASILPLNQRCFVPSNLRLLNLKHICLSSLHPQNVKVAWGRARLTPTVIVEQNLPNMRVILHEEKSNNISESTHINIHYLVSHHINSYCK